MIAYEISAFQAKKFVFNKNMVIKSFKSKVCGKILQPCTQLSGYILNILNNTCFLKEATDSLKAKEH